MKSSEGLILEGSYGIEIDPVTAQRDAALWKEEQERQKKELRAHQDSLPALKGPDMSTKRKGQRFVYDKAVSSADVATFRLYIDEEKEIQIIADTGKVSGNPGFTINAFIGMDSYYDDILYVGTLRKDTKEMVIMKLEPGKTTLKDFIKELDGADGVYIRDGIDKYSQHLGGTSIAEEKATEAFNIGREFTNLKFKNIM